MQNRPRHLRVNEEAIEQAVAAAVAAGEGEDRLTVQELMLNIAQFGLSADDGTRSEIQSEDPELREAIERSIAETEGNLRLPPPASQKAMATLKTKKYAGETFHRQEATCAVCSEDYKYGEELLFMPCEHVFHKACLLPWLKSTNSCPVCRMTLETDDEKYEETRVRMSKTGNKLQKTQPPPHGNPPPDAPPGAPQAVEPPAPPPSGFSRASSSRDTAVRRIPSTPAPRHVPSVSPAPAPPLSVSPSTTAAAAAASASPSRQSTIERLMAREVPRLVSSPAPRLSGRNETQSFSSSRVVAQRRAGGRLQGEHEAMKRSFSRGSSSGSNGRMEKQR